MSDEEEEEKVFYADYYRHKKEKTSGKCLSQLAM
jgi:hypothetical protein